MVRIHPLVPLSRDVVQQPRRALRERETAGASPAIPTNSTSVAEQIRHPTSNRIDAGAIPAGGAISKGAVAQQQSASLTSRRPQVRSLPVPPFLPAKKKQSIRVPLKDEQAGASPVAGAIFTKKEVKLNIRTPRSQRDNRGANPRRSSDFCPRSSM